MLTGRSRKVESCSPHYKSATGRFWRIRLLYPEARALLDVGSDRLCVDFVKIFATVILQPTAASGDSIFLNIAAAPELPLLDFVFLQLQI
jgi:hypothetical protein